MLLAVFVTLICTAIAGIAATRGYKSPLYPASGVALYFIFGNIAAAMIPDAPDFMWGILAATASVVSVSGIVLLQPKKDARAQPKKSSVPYLAYGLVCWVLAGAVGVVWLYNTGSQRSGTPIALVGSLLVSAALTCHHLDKQQALRFASDVLSVDSRPPVLFLRSFRSDTVRIKPWGSGLLLGIPEWVGKSFEEFLAPAMARTGPFIGLGNPEDYLPPGGASKAYHRDDEWREAVLDYLRRAAVVILLEGSTGGLRWELEQVRQRCSPRRVFLLTPTKEFRHAAWGEFAHLLKEAGFEVSDVADVGPGAVVGFDGSFRPVTLCQNATTADEYANVIMDWMPPSEAVTASLPPPVPHVLATRMTEVRPEEYSR